MTFSKQKGTQEMSAFLQHPHR